MIVSGVQMGRRTLCRSLHEGDRAVGPDLCPLRKVRPREGAFAILVYEAWRINQPGDVVRERDALVQGAEVGRVAVDRVLGELVLLRRHAQSEREAVSAALRRTGRT